MEWWCLLLGAAAAGPIWITLSAWVFRRIWRGARRLSARSRGRGHLVELGQLAGGLAHEIKNPLSTINVNLKLLSEDLRRHDDQTHRRWMRRLSHVQQEADRLRGILDDFLRYAGKYELTLRTVDLRQVVSEVADFFAPQADAAHVLLRTALPEQDAPCRVDSNLIKQAVLNLMINSVQAMEGGGELLLRVETRRDEVVLEVIDTGPGMSREQLGKVFQVYYSTKPGGSGLGLPTTRRIVREHGGTIRAESEPGKGTRFILALPLAKT